MPPDLKIQTSKGCKLGARISSTKPSKNTTNHVQAVKCLKGESPVCFFFFRPTGLGGSASSAQPWLQLGSDDQPRSKRAMEGGRWSVDKGRDDQSVFFSFL